LRVIILGEIDVAPNRGAEGENPRGSEETGDDDKRDSPDNFHIVLSMLRDFAFDPYDTPCPGFIRRIPHETTRRPKILLYN
jgi:hypothetical protein